VVQVAVIVEVVMAKTLVSEMEVFVMTLPDVIVTAAGVIVFVALAYPLGSMTVESGPVVMTFEKTLVVVAVWTGVDVMLNVTVGVMVVVLGVPTVRYRSLCHAKGIPSSPLLPRTRSIQCPDFIWFFWTGHVDVMSWSSGKVEI
jgi:hypothetical protein